MNAAQGPVFVAEGETVSSGGWEGHHSAFCRRDSARGALGQRREDGAVVLCAPWRPRDGDERVLRAEDLSPCVYGSLNNIAGDFLDGLGGVKL